ncbi:hypothetical protein ENSA5_20260 [Enhygromyxa salina]|uniref:Keratin associated protein n=1 Tax=Enhygromyxa salina TaxID=215803 RepID=A0A2S9YCM0_9BACT|nr:hypothetical protein [Enhygromyxa salina]PRQ02849.1 hypothetical protein ENSA5_20260 [Enhygromyxa salina]
MQLNSNRIFALAGFGLLAGASLSALQGCDPVDSAGLPGCDISCPTKGIAEGNASISGIAQVDAFFGAVLDLSAAANSVSASLRAELDAIARSVGLEPGASSSEIVAGINAKLELAIDVDAGLTINVAPPKCEASVEVAVAAAAACDAELEPGTANVECRGACEAGGGVEASCAGTATLICTGQAPGFDCTMGTCEGRCELELGAGASCDGTCRGTCTGNCSVVDAQGNCAGKCDASCEGTCELAAAAEGNCKGACTGSCTYTPPSGNCEADASAKCEAMAGATVQCDGRCEGEITQPSVSAECQATVDAKANASVECKPPSIGLTWQWSEAYQNDPMLQAEFKSWIKGFKTHTAVMLAAQTKAAILIESLEDLGNDGVTALESAGNIVSSADVVGTFKLTNCALPQLDAAAELAGSASASLSAEVNASVEVFTAVGIN